MSSPVISEPTVLFQLKGGLYPLTALQLLGTDLSAFEEQLDAKIQQAPKFFHNAPMVIDLQRLQDPAILLDFQLLKDILLKKRLIPVGIKNGHATHQAAAMKAGFPILQDSAKERAQKEAAKASPTLVVTEAGEPAIQGSPTRVVTEHVRSGQQIYVQGGDLIVLASVSHGAELLADGHIHVYGALRGRALAGVTGDQQAHIFCHSLEAELISIAGQYKISEDIEEPERLKAVDISLKQGRLHIHRF